MKRKYLKTLAKETTIGPQNDSDVRKTSTTRINTAPCFLQSFPPVCNKCGDSWPWGNTIILLLVIVTILIITVGIVASSSWSLSSSSATNDQHQNCSRERCHFGQDLEFIDQSFLPVFSVLAMLTFFSTWLSGKLYQYCRNNQFWASSYPPTQLHPNRPTLWKIFIAASRDLIEATCLLRKYFPQPSFKSTLSTVPYFTLKRPHMDRAAIILTLLDPEGGGRSAPSRANVNTHKNQWVEILIIFCIFLREAVKNYLADFFR